MKHLAAIALLVSCSSLSGLTRLDAMGPEELQRYSERTGAQVAQVALVAVREGDLTPEQLGAISAALRGLAAGGQGSLSSILGPQVIEDYEGLALTILLTELDAQLEARGAYAGSALSDAGRFVVLELATALDEVRQP